MATVASPSPSLSPNPSFLPTSSSSSSRNLAGSLRRPLSPHLSSSAAAAAATHRRSSSPTSSSSNPHLHHPSSAGASTATATTTPPSRLGISITARRANGPPTPEPPAATPRPAGAATPHGLARSPAQGPPPTQQESKVGARLRDFHPSQLSRSQPQFAAAVDALAHHPEVSSSSSSSSSSSPRFAERGTQYSPLGYPPTSSVFSEGSFFPSLAQTGAPRSGSKRLHTGESKEESQFATSSPASSRVPAVHDPEPPREPAVRENPQPPASTDRSAQPHSQGQPGVAGATSNPAPSTAPSTALPNHPTNPTPPQDPSTPPESFASNQESTQRPPLTDNATNQTALASRPHAADSPADTSPQKRAKPDVPMEKEVPRNYADCDVTDLGVLISDMLLDLVRINDKIPLKDGQLTRFHSRAPPAISIRDYLARLIHHATLSPPLLLSMVYYIDRLCALYPAFTISSLTVHRFLITSATVAAKGLSDSFWTNNTYARVGGVSVKELALLELDFLEKMQWRIVPREEVLVDYYRSLVERNPGFRIAET